MIRRLEKITIGDTRPELTLILDVPAEQGLARASKRRGAQKADRFEAEAPDFHQKLRDAYRQLAAEEPERCVLIDATAPREAVGRAIWDIVDKRFDPATAPLFVEGVRDMSEPTTAMAMSEATLRIRAGPRICSGMPRPKRRCSTPIAAAASRMPG